MPVPEKVRDWWLSTQENDPYSRESVCDYLHEYPDYLDEHMAEVCHASLNRDSPHDRFAFSTSLRRGRGGSSSYSEVPADFARDYWEYIFHPKISPYRKALKGDVQWIWGDEEPIAIRLTDMHIPTQVLGALCITSRHPLEAEPHIMFYGWLREKGMTQADAFYFSIYLGWLDNDRKRVGIPSIHNTNHYSFDRSGHVDYHLVVQGKPKHANRYFDDKGNYAGINLLFTSLKPFRSLVLEAKKKGPKKAVRVYNGLFPNLWQQYQEHLAYQELNDHLFVGQRNDVLEHCLTLKDKWNGEKTD